ncbi:response regulator [Paenibacillus rhizovicinus]|uniref:Response regulator n=1 Tax=Paenibacillus rhizovicinus TaxID=2704463 RepID=A0A6C0NZG5_9BACL|nr:response regulator [Paenibacillus rhizovicinus]QHW31618.1 response regulator [Paenibacillus rhizovicinus]
MYKLLIVDDEKEIREGLASWPWHQVGIEVAGCCSHGLEALQFVEEKPVDLVITDIRMPFMDGIELMTALNARYPFIRVVILSGYNDFEYAQKALQFGAIDYLLKPLQFQMLHDTFFRAVERLREEKQAEFRVSVLKRKAELLARVLRAEFLRRLFQEPLSEAELEQGFSDGEVLLEGNFYTVAVFRPDRLAEPGAAMGDKEKKLLAFSLDNILTDLWEGKELGYHWVNGQTSEAYVLSMKREAEAHFAELLPQWRKYRGLFKSAFSGGVGRPVGSPADIYLSAQAASAALAANPEEGTLAIGESAAAANRPAAAVIASKEQAAAGTAAAAGGFEADTEPVNMLLVQAKQYIQDHFNRSLTLKEVADQVHISGSHLFALFKNSGQTFLSFLTAIRLQRAMELLSGSNLKIYEIVEQVGYSDPAYFTEVFKKYTGKTPHEYRCKSR